MYIGLIAMVLGALFFTLNWHLYDWWGDPLPGYRLVLWPGNLSLVYIWHPMLTEEINFWPKLFLLLFGQFSLVTLFAAGVKTTYKKLAK